MNDRLSVCHKEKLLIRRNNIHPTVKKKLNTHKNFGKDVEGTDDSNFPKDNP